MPPLSLSRETDIGHHSGYKTRVTAEYFYELSSEGDLSRLHEIYTYSREKNLPLLIIGGGTNILFSRAYYHGIIVKNNLSGWDYDTKSQLLKTNSNESIWKLAESLEQKYNQPLWHRFIGLPGSVGGAIYGNAGCFGLETESNFVSCRLYDMNTGKISEVEKKDMGFAYRHSFLKNQHELFVISAIFDLSKKVEKYHSEVDNMYFREHKQPKGYSCGSFWKNPDKDHSAGSLIERVGLKGYRHGGARWSDLHANFLLSDGETCKPSDLIELIELTQRKVGDDTGYDLIPEVQIV